MLLVTCHLSQFTKANSQNPQTLPQELFPQGDWKKFWTKVANSETMFLSSIIYKESFCKLSFWPRTFVNGKNKTFIKNGTPYNIKHTIYDMQWTLLLKDWISLGAYIVKICPAHRSSTIYLKLSLFHSDFFCYRIWWLWIWFNQMKKVNSLHNILAYYYNVVRS